MKIEYGLWETQNGSKVIVDFDKTYGHGLQAIYFATGEIYSLKAGYQRPAGFNLSWNADGLHMPDKRADHPLNLVKRLGPAPASSSTRTVERSDLRRNVDTTFGPA